MHTDVCNVCLQHNTKVGISFANLGRSRRRSEGAKPQLPPMFPDVKVEFALISLLLQGPQGGGGGEGVVGGTQVRGVTRETREEVKLVHKKKKEGQLEVARTVLHWLLLVHCEDPEWPIRFNHMTETS